MIRASVRFVLRWQARSPFLAPPVLFVLLAFSMTIPVLFFEALVVWTAMQLDIDTEPFSLSVWLAFPFMACLAPATWSGMLLSAEAMWMAFGVYELLGARDNAIRDSIRRWASYELEETKT